MLKRYVKEKNVNFCEFSAYFIDNLSILIYTGKNCKRLQV